VKYLLALLSLIAFTSQAEPLYLPLSQARVDSLKARLWQSAPDTNRVNLLVQLSNDLIDKKYILGKPIDSAAVYIRQAQALSKALGFKNGQIDSDYALAYLVVFDKGNQARKTISSALARSQQRHDKAREAIGWYLLGCTHDYSPAQQIQSARYFERAAQLFRANHDQRREAHSLKEVADAHLIMGKTAQAQAELLHVLDLYRACGYRELHYTFDLLTATNDALGNYKEALQYAIAAVQSAKSCQDTTLLRAFYIRLGSEYQQLNQLEQTVHYYQLAMRNAEQYQDVHTVLDMTLATATLLITLKHPQQALALVQQKQQAFPAHGDFNRQLPVAEAFALCYLATRQYKLAITWCKQLELLATSPAIKGDRRVQQGIYNTIGSVYLATKHYSKAQAYLLKALASGQLAINRSGVAKTCLLLFKADSAQGNLLSAIKHYKRYKALNDSIFNEQNSKQVARLQIQYDTEKREQSIALLTKQSLLQQMTIRQRGFQLNVFLGGTLLLAGLLGVSFNRYRLKQRSTRLLEQKQHALEAQQTEINRKNEALEQVLCEKDHLLEERQGLLVEKDWMLKEIHHRVKNNLQVVSSLLSTQSRHLLDPQAVAAIRESQNRVQVMALLHQKLYQADNLGRVNLADYAREIVTYLVESFDRQHSVQTKLGFESIELETTLATPLGLIINEAVTNALKHAFPPPRRGTLTVSLVSLAPQQYQLTITDDGVGLPPSFDLTRSRSLGMVIIKGLSRQIDGYLAVSTADGVCISLQFDTSKKPVHAEAVA
jgi:two-component sensor histidine kinase